MIDISKGRYWDMPWSLVSGCTPCSPGCDHCWSLAMEKRFRKYQDEDGEWLGHKVLVHPERLSIPLKRRRPTVYAVWNDLFHEEVPFAFIEEAFEIMRYTFPRHEFLVLTKRPERMVQYWQWRRDSVLSPNQNSVWPESVYPGLTVCNQQEADEKLPVFLQVPGKKFLSIEPMLGPVDLVGGTYGPNFLEGWEVVPEHDPRCDGSCNVGCPVPVQVQTGKIDAVILGGETGPGARPLHPDWVRSVRDQCAVSGTPFFFKSWGQWCPDDFETVCRSGATPKRISVMPDGSFTDYSRAGSVDMMRNVKRSRLLDGRTHDDLPWVLP